MACNKRLETQEVQNFEERFSNTMFACKFCPDELNFDDFDEDHDLMHHQVLICPYAGCGMEFKNDIMDCNQALLDHFKECQGALYQCSNNDCG